VNETPKSEATIGDERAERDLFQRLVDGEITMAGYQMDAADTLQEFMRGFRADCLPFKNWHSRDIQKPRTPELNADIPIPETIRAVQIEVSTHLSGAGPRPADSGFLSRRCPCPPIPCERKRLCHPG
jgi:hypothetical protein